MVFCCQALIGLWALDLQALEDAVLSLIDTVMSGWSAAATDKQGLQYLAFIVALRAGHDQGELRVHGWHLQCLIRVELLIAALDLRIMLIINQAVLNRGQCSSSSVLFL